MNIGYDPNYFSTLALLEENNFWFNARNRLIIWAIKKYFPNTKDFYEIGCGTGFVLSGIKNAFPDMQLSGSELLAEGLHFAKSRVSDAIFFQKDARELNSTNEFNLIGAFDVLEHIEEDECVLQNIHRSLKPQGGLLLTVPQHAFLWSRQDELSYHVRRYQAKELRKKMSTAGFEIIATTSFMSLLLPVMMLSRWLNVKKNDVFSELKLPKWVDVFFGKISQLEYKLIHLGVRFPMGGSLLMVAKKI